MDQGPDLFDADTLARALFKRPTQRGTFRLTGQQPHQRLIISVVDRLLPTPDRFFLLGQDCIRRDIKHVHGRQHHVDYRVKPEIMQQRTRIDDAPVVLKHATALKRFSRLFKPTTTDTQHAFRLQPLLPLSRFRHLRDVGGLNQAVQREVVHFESSKAGQRNKPMTRQRPVREQAVEDRLRWYNN